MLVVIDRIYDISRTRCSDHFAFLMVTGTDMHRISMHGLSLTAVSFRIT